MRAHALLLVVVMVVVVGLAGAAVSPAQSVPVPKIESVVMAAAQPSDTDPNVIWYDDFDVDRITSYLEPAPGSPDAVLSSVEYLGGSGMSMQCYYPTGQTGYGNRKLVFGDSPIGNPVHPGVKYEDIYWRIYVKHQDGWSGNAAKMSRAIGFVSTSWNESFITHVWGGNGDELCLDPVSGIRRNKVVTRKYNDFGHFTWLGVAYGTFPIHATAEAGRWVCVEARMKLNTPGLADGYIALWIDGKLDVQESGLDFRQNWTQKGINAIFLEAYWNTGSPFDEYRWYDDFVVSTQPIGPVAAPPNPQLIKSAYGDCSAWEAAIATDPDGADVVWASNAGAGVPGANLTVNTANGVFQGSQAGRTSLASGPTYFCNVRQRSTAGVWSAWYGWHQPFTVTP